jgi:putative FmdB family regulatory protein
MPVYEFRCLACDTRFEARRAMADADAPATCPNGHADVRRLLSVFAAAGRASQPLAAASGGGCCGGGCGCR